MTDLIPIRFKNFIDAIFEPPRAFLQMIVDTLNDVSLVAGKGLNLNNYFSFFAYLPDSLQQVIQAAIASVIFLGLIYVAKASWNIYLNVKGSIKWW